MSLLLAPEELMVVNSTDSKATHWPKTQARNPVSFREERKVERALKRFRIRNIAEPPVTPKPLTVRSVQKKPEGLGSYCPCPCSIL